MESKRCQFHTQCIQKHGRSQNTSRAILRYQTSHRALHWISKSPRGVSCPCSYAAGVGSSPLPMTPKGIKQARGKKRILINNFLLGYYYYKYNIYLQRIFSVMHIIVCLITIFTLTFPQNLKWKLKLHYCKRFVYCIYILKYLYCVLKPSWIRDLDIDITHLLDL